MLSVEEEVSTYMLSVKEEVSTYMTVTFLLSVLVKLCSTYTYLVFSLA